MAWEWQINLQLSTYWARWAFSNYIHVTEETSNRSPDFIQRWLKCHWKELDILSCQKGLCITYRCKKLNQIQTRLTQNHQRRLWRSAPGLRTQITTNLIGKNLKTLFTLKIHIRNKTKLQHKKALKWLSINSYVLKVHETVQRLNTVQIQNTTHLNFI